MSAKPFTAPQGGFDRLLRLLDADPGRADERFAQLRDRLVRLFLWRGSTDPDALADETLERVSAKLAEGVEVAASDPFRYVAGFARRVGLEAHRRARRERSALEAAGHEPPGIGIGPEDEQRLGCLDRCLDLLSDAERRHVLRFYRGEKGQRIAERKALAAELGITANALRIRAHRWRLRLEGCVRACMARAEPRETDRDPHAPPNDEGAHAPPTP